MAAARDRGLLPQVAKGLAYTWIVPHELGRGAFGLPQFPEGRVDAALEDFDFRRATGAVLSIVEEANRYIDRVRPWELAKTGREADALATLLYACRALGAELGPFVPDLAARVTKQCTAVDGALPAPLPLIKRRAPQPVREPKPVPQQAR